MSLGRRDWSPTPFTEFLFPSGKSLSTFVTQFPRCQTSKYLLTGWGGMELQRCRGSSPAGATPAAPCTEQPSAEMGSSRKFCFSGTKRFGGKEVILLRCDGKSARDFALRPFRIVSVHSNVSFISCTTVRAGLILSEPSPSTF